VTSVITSGRTVTVFNAKQEPEASWSAARSSRGRQLPLDRLVFVRGQAIS
jgi:hypothetical protein